MACLLGLFGGWIYYGDLEVSDSPDENGIDVSGKMHQIASPKTVKHPECPADAVIVNVPFSDLGKIAGSSSLIIGALGFTMRMKPADIQSLRRFMRTVRDGVRIEKAVALPGSTVNSCGLQKIERARAELGESA